MLRNETPIKDLLRFDGQWRSYQKRVLDRADQYLRDNRIHIVAAPGICRQRRRQKVSFQIP